MTCRPLALLAAFGLAASLGGCAGYELGPVKPTYLARVKTIAVPTARSEDLIPRLETLVTNAVIKEMQRDGTYRVVNGGADAVLLVTAESATRTATRTVRGNVLLPSEFVLDLRLRYELRAGSRTGRVLDGGKVSGQTTLFVSTDLEQDQRQAVPRAAEQAAARLVSQLSEGF